MRCRSPFFVCEDSDNTPTHPYRQPATPTASDRTVNREEDAAACEISAGD
jgi:hypothetical protein